MAPENPARSQMARFSAAIRSAIQTKTRDRCEAGLPPGHTAFLAAAVAVESMCAASANAAASESCASSAANIAACSLMTSGDRDGAFSAVPPMSHIAPLRVDNIWCVLQWPMSSGMRR